MNTPAIRHDLIRRLVHGDPNGPDIEMRGAQIPAIECSLRGNDVLVIAPTGGGKSLIFQYPIAHWKGLGIVVSPLIALQKDQVDALRAKGFKAEYYNSTIRTTAQQNDILDRCTRGDVQFLYITPESLLNKHVLDALSPGAFDDGLRVTVLALDEAHVVGQWGEGFRTKYSRLARIIEQIRPFSVIAVTATMTEEYRCALERSIGWTSVDDYQEYIEDPEREELELKTFMVPNDKYPEQHIAAIIRDRHMGERGIIYTLTVKMADRLQPALLELGIPVLRYHGQMSAKQRPVIQKRWMEQGGVVVATSAFGMGIDAPDVRFIIHAQMPLSIVDYLQQIGRAARDRKKSTCYIVHQRNLWTHQHFLDIANPPLWRLQALHEFYVEESAGMSAFKIQLTAPETAKRMEEWAKDHDYESFWTPGHVQSCRSRLDYFEHVGKSQMKARVANIRFIKPPPAKQPARLKCYEMAQGIAVAVEDSEMEDLDLSALDKALSGMDVKDVRTWVLGMLRKMQKDGCIEYAPPYSGTVVRILKDEFSVPEDEVERKRDEDRSKLMAMVRYFQIRPEDRWDYLRKCLGLQAKGEE